ncbi:MAG TPA: iron-sulfur cluster assembly scaffold protein [Patescibacteria group bacterium]|nr:iron-sulfur cluster assembly scaffold protein [Patescibacteria group bacterium]
MADFGNLYPSLYSEKVMKHIRHPQNLGEIKNPDGMGTEGNPVCGDVMRLFIKVGKKKDQEYIKDIKFQTLGCGAAIASSSMLTIMVKGKTLAEAQKMTRQSIAKALGGLPPAKIHCSVLAAAALKKAIKDYQQKKK